MPNESFKDIFEAIEKGTVADVRYFVEQKGADVNAKGEYGNTPLHWAADGNGEDTLKKVQYLISQGADVNAKSEYGYTPLRYAAAHSSLAVVQYLVSQGAEVDAKDKYGTPPLFAAVSHGNLDIVQYLVSQGADVNAKDKNGKTPLHHIAKGESWDNSNSANEALQYLILQGADLNVKDNDGKTPLDLAKENGNTAVAEYLAKQKTGEKIPSESKPEENNTTNTDSSTNETFGMSKVITNADDPTNPPVIQYVSSDVNTAPSLKPAYDVHVAPLEIKLGALLTSFADTSRGGDLLDRIHRLRNQIAEEIGIIIPKTHIKDSFTLDVTEYEFFIDGQPVAKGAVFPGRFLALDTGTVIAKVQGLETFDPVYGTQALWIDAAIKEQAEIYGYTVVEPEAVIMTHLFEVVRKHAAEILTVDMTQHLLNTLQETSPVIVGEVLRYLTLAQIRQVLQCLLREQMSIRQLETILGALLEYWTQATDLLTLATSVRKKLAQRAANFELAATDQTALNEETDKPKHEFSIALLNCDMDLEILTKRIMGLKEAEFSLCLYGVSGSGKSAYARFLAEKLNMKVLHKRASDLMSKWIGENEQNIAAAFAEAKQKKMLLVLDEADSFLQDRRRAHHTWEVTQVNELLAQMESHPLPFICTTNLMDNLDQASLRRFTFKVKYDFLTRPQVELAFRHFFGAEQAVSLTTLNCLSPGDFAVVAKKVRIFGIDDPGEIVTMLRQEQDIKGVKTSPIVCLAGL